MSNELRLVTLPSSDAAFREDVDRVADEFDPDISDDDLRRHLIDHLHAWYRSVEVTEQNHLAQHDFLTMRVWYVYRDGRVRPGNERRERLYAALASARRTCDASRTAMADAHEAARAAGYDGPASNAAVGALDPVEALRQSTRRAVSST